MASTTFASLLEPVTPDNPCGEDLSYSQEFLEIETLLRGKAETQFSEAVKPDWKQVRERSFTLLGRCKHLQLATTLCVAELELGGLAAAADSLEFLDELLKKYWSGLHPRLDPADEMDPLERLNILSTLCTPLGTFGDPYCYLLRMARAPLATSPVLGKLSHSDIHSSDYPGEAGSQPSDPRQVEAAFRDTAPDQLLVVNSCLSRLQTVVRGILDFLQENCGNARVPDFQPLIDLIVAMQGDLAPYLPVEAQLPDESAGVPNQAVRMPGGAVQSRDDVVASLDRICDYYRRCEPSSPIPLLLERARRLVHSSFMEIVGDLAPDALGQVRTVTGQQAAEKSSS